MAACGTPATRDLARNLGMCPDLESNPRPFGVPDDAQPTEPHQPGQIIMSLSIFSTCLSSEIQYRELLMKLKLR